MRHIIDLTVHLCSYALSYARHKSHKSSRMPQRPGQKKIRAGPGQKKIRVKKSGPGRAGSKKNPSQKIRAGPGQKKIRVKKSGPGRVTKKSGSKNLGRAGSKKSPGQKIWAGPGQKTHGPGPEEGCACAPHTPCTCGGCAPTTPPLASTVNQNTARVLAVLV